jgi:PadR family transcriptional regulator, regulatory protein PadR
MRRLSYSAVSVLHAVGSGVRYGFDIMDRTELPSGTVYPALSRLERDGYVKSHWEDLHKAHDDRRPPRRYYRLTAQGERVLAEALERFHSLKPLKERTPGIAPRAARAKS